jgi:hypothetical protein
MPFANQRTMSLSREEFAASIAKLGPHTNSADGNPLFGLQPGSVEIRYAPAPSKTFGGLLALPQAIVTLVFDATSPESEAQFLHRFDICFQRGGG